MFNALKIYISSLNKTKIIDFNSPFSVSVYKWTRLFNGNFCNADPWLLLYERIDISGLKY